MRPGQLLERDGELGSIDRLLDAARVGSGRCLLVEAGPGLGKSRLVAAACERAAATGMLVAHARCSELEIEFSFGAALQFFEPLLDRVDAAERTALLSGAAALTEPLFEASAPDPGDEQAFSVFHGLHWLSAGLAERAPLLIALDDAHWCDLPTLRFLLYVLQRLDELPIALLVTTRPTEDGEQAKLARRIARHRLTDRAQLAPLTQDAVAALVRDVLGDAAEDAFCRACASATGGNPFYLVQMLDALDGQGIEPRAGAVHRLSEVGAESIADAVLARVDALPAACERVASATAVLGDGASLAKVAAVAGLDDGATAEAADRLALAGVLEAGVPIGFSHPIVRSAIYARLGPARRARAHDRAAHVLADTGADPERVGAQLLLAGGAEGSWAVAALRDAARRARRRGAPDASARYLRGALAASGDDTAVLIELAHSEARAHEPTATERAERALAAVPDPHDRAAAALRLGMALLDGGMHHAATEVFGRGLEGVEPGEEVAMTLRACRAASGGLEGAADAPLALDAVLARAEQGELTRPERLLLAHGALLRAFSGTAIEEVRRLARLAVDGAEPDPGNSTDLILLTHVAIALVTADDLELAERVTNAAIERVRELGSAIGFATLSHLRAWAHYRAGRLSEAIADAQSVLDGARYGWEPALPAAHAVIALALLERGDAAGAETALELPGGDDRWRTTFTWNDYLQARGELRLATGDVEAALADFEECGRGLAAVGADHPSVVPWRPGAARACVRLGDSVRARKLADEDIERARAFGAPRAVGAALRTAGAIAGGDRGVELLREACDVLASSEGRLEYGHTLADLGAALFAQQHRLAATEPLRIALDVANRCGATALEERVRALLLKVGARPRRAAFAGRDALTPRERRLAEMAAEGHTNRQIAEALFITTKTVETHLRHVFEKLSIGSRRDLPEALARGRDPRG